MKLLIISDTHGDNTNAIRVIKTINSKINSIIHLGDYDEDAKIILHEFPNIPIYYVAGNCDFASSTLKEQILTFNGTKILITHGHRYNVKWNYDRIFYLAKERGVQAVLFGHTHIATIEYKESIVLINPGSISEPRNTSIPSYCIIDITDSGLLKASIVGVFGNDDYRVIL